MDEWTEPAIPDETPIDPSDYKDKSIRSRAASNVAEAEGIRKATLKYLSKKPSSRTARFNVTWVLKLHEEMFGAVWISAGQIRSAQLNIGVPVASIVGELQDMLDNLNSWSASGMPLIEQAAMLHYHAVRIHPFKNGNGRWARMLANIWLKKHDQLVVIWPDEVNGTESIIRAEYIRAIKAADAGKFEPLTELHRRYQSAS